MTRRSMCGSTGRGSRRTTLRPLPDAAALHVELRRPGVTLQLLHLEYLERHPDGYRYTKFCEVYRAWVERRAPTMRQVHVAGDKMFVDYSGKKPHYVERSRRGRSSRSSCSSRSSARRATRTSEATHTQTVADFTSSNARALTYFGGVPNAIVPDQLKSAVTIASRYEPELATDLRRVRASTTARRFCRRALGRRATRGRSK